MRGRQRASTGAGRVELLAMLAACALLVALYSRDWELPGLYIDAVNPEYLIPGILEPPGSLVFSVPGNRLGDRFPVLTATLYHGSAQLYAALPFMAVFGASLRTLRLFQLGVGLAILALTLALARRGRSGGAALVALFAAGTLAVEPSFVLALRTQAYGILFSVLLLLGSLWLLLGWRTARRPRLCVLASGALYGLATFGYFVIAFFLPAMVWIGLRRDADSGPEPIPRAHAPALWAAGLVLGESPFLLGILLLTVESGGLAGLAEFVRDSAIRLQPGQDASGLPARIGTVLGSFWSVATGEWPWLQILQDRGTGALDHARAAALVTLPALCLALRIGSRAEQRALAVPVALIVSYLVVSLTFAGRLGGHHFTALMPLLYLAFAVACAAFWPAEPRNALPASARSSTVLARGAGVGAGIVAVLATGLVAQERLHLGLARTGGVRLYSDAIDRFAAWIDREMPNATIHAPDFGYSLSLAFLSRAPHVRDVVQVGEIQTERCAGRPQLVVLDRVENERRLELLSRLIGAPASLATWSQRDGVPVFQVAHFAGGPGCAPPEPTAGLAAGIGPAITLDPPSFPACAFLGRRSVVRVHWLAGAGAKVVIHVTPPGEAEILWSAGGTQGVAATGPWAVPGMSFTLRDQASGRVLSTAVLESSPCPPA